MIIVEEPTRDRKDKEVAQRKETTGQDRSNESIRSTEAPARHEAIARIENENDTTRYSEMRRRPEPAGKMRVEEMTPNTVTARRELASESISSNKKEIPRRTDIIPKEGERTSMVTRTRVTTPISDRPVEKTRRVRNAYEATSTEHKNENMRTKAAVKEVDRR